MPLEILVGPEVPALLERAQTSIGADAVVLSVKRITENGRRTFEMVASDPVTAERHRRPERPARGGAEGFATEPRRRAPRAADPAWRPAAAPEDTARSWSLPGVPGGEAAPEEVPPAPARRAGWRFSVPAPAARDTRRPWVVALVGPTGAGKTTTIAKLANHTHAFAGRRVGLLCLDTYRIGGVEQLRQYAELSRLPFEVVWEARDITRAMRRLRDRDVVLVDTPGRGPRAAEDFRQTQVRLLEIAPDEVHLALPSGLQPSLARQVVTAHLSLGVTHLLPTKLDEHPDERGSFDLARQFGLPMRWLADGQEVPRDLQLAPATPGIGGTLALAAAA